MISPVEIHISDVRTFKTCRRKWDFSSLLRKGLEPRVPYMPFFTGRAIHYALEQMYETGEHPTDVFHNWLEKELQTMEERTGALWPKEREKIEEEVELIEGMMDHYVVWQRHSHGLNSDENLEVIATEIEFHIPIGWHCPLCEHTNFREVQYPKGWRVLVECDACGLTRIHTDVRWIELAGRFDGVVRRKSDNTLWLFESKTTRSIQELKRSLINDEQAGLYAWAAQQILGEPIAGVLYNLMRKKVPTWPRVLKDGSLSRNKSIDTTVYAYWEAIKSHYQDKDPDNLKKHYREMLDHLADKGNTFFERYEVRRTQDEMFTLVEHLKATTKDMLDPQLVLYPTPGWMTCNFCHFRAPCFAMNAGSDPSFLLEQEYQHRQQWDPLEGKEE